MFHTQINAAIAAMHNGKTVIERTDSANHLADLTRGIDPRSIDDGTLHEMILLLNSPEESVRGFVAAALEIWGRAPGLPRPS